MGSHSDAGRQELRATLYDHKSHHQETIEVDLADVGERIESHLREAHDHVFDAVEAGAPAYTHLDVDQRPPHKTLRYEAADLLSGLFESLTQYIRDEVGRTNHRDAGASPSD